MIRFATAVLVASAAVGLDASAQARIVDGGSFTIMVNGSRAGREEFLIRATPGPNNRDTYIATATVVLGNRRLTPKLETDEAVNPVAYQIETRGAEGTQNYAGTIARGHMSARIRTPRGESGKEYVVADGAFVLDDDVYHQYFFIARKEGSQGARPVIVPRRNAQITMRIARDGSEPVTIGGQSIPAQRWTVTEPGGEERQFWTDADGRVLRVAIPARGIVAQRDDPPR
jgi:hypothetical protein